MEVLERMCATASDANPKLSVRRGKAK